MIAAVILISFAAPASAESAYAAVTIEAQTGIALYSKNADIRRPMASTTKIMTALVALEEKPLDSVFVVSASAAAVDGSQMGLAEGEKITLRDLLYMLMLKSANDAAEVIAENVGGSIEGFAALMNARAEKIGLSDTHFVNPHGLPDDNHYTTARELALIAREALENKNFAELVSTKSAHISYRNMVLENSNRLLSSYGYANGVKTGFTKKAGRCLVSSATKDGVTLITVTLNDGNDWQDHVGLMESGFARVSCYEIYAPGEYVAERVVLNGSEKAVFKNTESIYGVIIDGVKQEYIFKENISPSLYAPLFTGKEIAGLGMYSGNDLVYETPLCLCENVDPKEEPAGFFRKWVLTFFRLLRNL